MKRRFTLLFTLIVLVVSFIPIAANASEDFKAYTPYDLTATLMEVDGTHPYGSALLTLKINNLPRNSSDTQFLYVHIEKKIGDGEWM